MEIYKLGKEGREWVCDNEEKNECTVVEENQDEKYSRVTAWRYDMTRIGWGEYCSWMSL